MALISVITPASQFANSAQLDWFGKIICVSPAQILVQQEHSLRTVSVFLYNPALMVRYGTQLSANVFVHLILTGLEIFAFNALGDKFINLM